MNKLYKIILIILITKPLYAQNMRYQVQNEQTGKVYTKEIGIEKNILSTALEFYPSFSDTSEVVNFEMSYHRDIKSYWLSIMGKYSNSLLSKISQGHPDLLIEPNQKIKILSTGIGLSVLTRQVGKLFNLSNLFELTSFYLTYSSTKTREGNNLDGWGLKTDFVIGQQGISGFYYGFKISHHLRELTDNDIKPASDGVLIFSTLTAGFDIGLQF